MISDCITAPLTGSTQIEFPVVQMRLKTVTLSYNFPKKWLNKIHLSRLQAYVTGQNLFTLTKYKGYDPEVNAFGGDSVAQGVDYGTYPQSRAVIFGLNVEF